VPTIRTACLLVLLTVILAACSYAPPYSPTREDIASTERLGMIEQDRRPFPKHHVTAASKKVQTASETPAAVPNADDLSTTGSTAGHFSRSTPNIGTPEWDRQQAEFAREDAKINQMIRNICRGC
jgi:cytochrome c556